jgi:predicted ester cyclase
MGSDKGQVSADDAKDIVRRRFDELDKGNAGIFDELFSPGYTLSFPGQEPLDLDATKRFYAEMYAAFSDLRHEIHEQVAEGDKVVTRWTATGRHTGEFMGFAPSGEVASFGGINIYTFARDKLVDSQVSWDLRGLQRAKARVEPTTSK